MARLPSFRSLLKQVLHLRESPQRTALAFAIGVFIAFSPTYGLHTAMVLFCTWALGLNFLALMVGAFINNPWTIVPILGATYWVGALLLGRSDGPSFDWHDLSFTAIYEQVMPYAVPFFLGGLVLSLLGAVLAYPLAYYFLARHRRAHPLDPIAREDSPQNL
ncbi:MAG: DUF2062 domain-containing protein [Nitrospirota bacterium]|nr:DUF2062 domain-containing protein [Nitrospirota bacterium]MDP2382584.1 DUF2062 domain-containing protein [Nitrospirota bacterium]MDP3595593.1 DUF2062 domain-containing protein [Nitrospirota bacterium]